MINRVGTVSVFVANQERAKQFYTEVLGFELRTDAPLYPGSTARWLAVAPRGAATEIVLYLPDENWEHYQQVVGKSQALTFDVTDMAGLHADLKAKGVTFVQGPDEQPWGTYAIIQDSEGNQLLLVEQPPA
ncbi:MAG: VOC family protein [Chloroflexota bacterium]|nr:VOC family protein [Chloroflexota bacterium]